MKRSEYELLAKTVDWYWWHVAKRMFIQSMLTKYSVGVNRSGLVFDFGCGVGSNYPLLSQYGQVIGCDISPTALRHARQFSYSKLLSNIGLTSQLYMNNTFDLLACIDVLYHQNINDLEVLSRLYQLAKPTAWLIVTDCAHQSLWSSHDAMNMARERYSVGLLQSRISKSGWTIVGFSYLFMMTFPLFVVSRLIANIFPIRTHSNEYELPSWLNQVLIMLCRVEAWILRFGRLPFGSSIIVLARKL